MISTTNVGFPIFLTSQVYILYAYYIYYMTVKVEIKSPTQKEELQISKRPDLLLGRIS